MLTNTEEEERGREKTNMGIEEKRGRQKQPSTLGEPFAEYRNSVTMVRSASARCEPCFNEFWLPSLAPAFYVKRIIIVNELL